MANLLYANQFFVTTLNVGGGIDDSQTTGIIIADVSGIDTTKPGMALINYSDPLNTTICEWVEYASINGSKELVTVVRGSEGFSAKSHDNQVQVAFPLTESHINRLADALSIGGVATNGVTGTLDEDTMSSNSAVKLATQQSIKAYVDSAAGVGGWITYSTVVPTRAGADDPTYTLTFAGVDLTAVLYPGMRVKWTQNSTVRYAIVTACAFSTDTTLTVYGGTDYDVDDTATHTISAFAYSRVKAPDAFPLSPAKWTVRVTDTTDRSQASPSADTWYNLGSISISIPIGIWRVWYSITAQIDKTGVNGIFTGLSTANNSVSDQDLISNVNASGAFTGHSLSKEKIIALSSKTAHYAITKTTASGATALYNRNGATSGATLIIEAVCSYL